MTLTLQEAVGKRVRELREAKGLTQEQLGRAAGYAAGKGAGVSVSRLENGHLKPTRERLKGIAEALGLTTDELVAGAVEETLGAPRTIPDRAARLQREYDRRQRLGADLEHAFNEAQGRAKRKFLLKLVEVAARIDGAPQPSPDQFSDEDIPTNSEADAEAAYLIQFTKLGVITALARVALGSADQAVLSAASDYSAFADGVAWGARVMAGTVPGLTRGSTAAIKGYGAAMRVGRGKALLPAVITGGAALALGAVLGAVIERARKRQGELDASLDQVEAEVAATQPGVDALEVLVPRATWILDYIAVHAGHALNRWEAKIGDGQVDWDSLVADDRARYQDFVDIAAAQLAVATIDFTDMMVLRDGELERAIALADGILAQSLEAVTSRV